MNPRIQVSVSDETYARVRRLARLQKISMSAVIGQLVETQSPFFDLVADLIEQVGNLDLLSEDAKNKILWEVVDSENYSSSLVEKAFDELKFLSQEVKGAKEKASRVKTRESAATARAAVLPPYINKGARKASEGGQTEVKDAGKAE